MSDSCKTCGAVYVWVDDGYYQEWRCPNSPHLYPLWELAAFLPAALLAGLWQLGLVGKTAPVVAAAIPAARLALIAYFAVVMFGGFWLFDRLRRLCRRCRRLDLAAAGAFMRRGWR